MRSFALGSVSFPLGKELQSQQGVLIEGSFYRHGIKFYTMLTSRTR